LTDWLKRQIYFSILYVWFGWW